MVYENILPEFPHDITPGCHPMICSGEIWADRTLKTVDTRKVESLAQAATDMNAILCVDVEDCPIESRDKLKANALPRRVRDRR